VNLTLAIRRLAAIFMIAGLALAPLSRPVIAGIGSGVTMDARADTAVEVTAVDMADDMPCCPSKAPAPVTCDKCVLMACCMSQFIAGMSTTDFQLFPVASGRVALLPNDFQPDGLGHPPPEHPPRRLV
jgi:hypothetical protein